MRKWLHGALALAISLAVAIPVAAAEHPLPAGQQAEARYEGHEGRPDGFTGEQKAGLRARWEQLKELQTEGKELHAAVRAESETQRRLRQELKERINGEQLRAQLKALQDELATNMAEADALKQSAQRLRKALQEAIDSGDKESAAEVRQALKALREEAEPTMARIATLRDELQSLRDQAAPVREEFAAVRERLAPLQTELETLFQALQDAHLERAQLLQEFREAVRAGQHGQAVSTLEHIIRVQQQHNETLADILDTLRQMTAVMVTL